MTLEVAALEAEAVRPEDAGFSSARMQRLDDAMRRLVDEGKLAGVVTLVARHGKIAHFGATGTMDVTTRRPIQRDTIFRIASITKPITCTAVMMLFEEGRFLLDDPISDFMPEFAHTRVFARETPHDLELEDLERPITIRHLLMHMAGFTGPNADSSHPVERLYAREQVRRLDSRWQTTSVDLLRYPCSINQEPRLPMGCRTTCWDDSSKSSRVKHLTIFYGRESSPRCR